MILNKDIIRPMDGTAYPVMTKWLNDEKLLDNEVQDFNAKYSLSTIEKGANYIIGVATYGTLHDDLPVKVISVENNST